MKEKKMAGAEMLDDETLAGVAGGVNGAESVAIHEHVHDDEIDCHHEDTDDEELDGRPAFSMCFYCWKPVKYCTCRTWNKNF